VSGTSATLESLETSFHQDLNGDGTIGVVVAAAAIVEMPLTSAPALQAPPVSLGRPSNDAFVFAPGAYEKVTGIGTSADLIELSALSSSPALQAGQPTDHDHNALASGGALFEVVHVPEIIPSHFIL
jgi:hypothetical protein